MKKKVVLIYVYCILHLLISLCRHCAYIAYEPNSLYSYIALGLSNNLYPSESNSIAQFAYNVKSFKCNFR